MGYLGRSSAVRQERVYMIIQSYTIGLIWIIILLYKILDKLNELNEDKGTIKYIKEKQ